MSINPLTFGSPVYSPPFSVSPGDTDVMKLRSMETAPLSHESLDENFTNLGNKINEILGLKIDQLDIGGDGKLGLANLALTAGAGLDLTSTGQFSHQARPTPVSGYSYTDLGNSNRRFVNALDFDDFGHVIGYKTNTLDFEGTGSVSVDQSTFGKVVISSDSYSSGDSPAFSYLKVSNTGPKIQLETTNPLHRNWEIAAQEDVDQGFQIGYGSKDASAGNDTYTSAFVIKDSGNVGIGTTSPDFKLTVDNGIGNEGLKVIAGNNGDVNESVFEAWNDKVNGSAPELLFKIRGDGNVGIGTASPDYKLDVRGWINAQANALSTDAVINLAGSNNANYSAISRIKSTSESNSNGASSLTFSTRDEDNDINENMRIASNGDVGIGTTSPKAKLEVKRGKNGFPNTDISNDDVTALRLIGSDNAVLDMGVNGGNGTWIQARNKLSDNQPYSLLLNPNGGKVGIGTTNPTASLDIVNTSTTTTSSYGLSVQGGGNSASTGYSLRALDQAGNVDFFVRGDGNVGIGTTSPNYKLEVHGDPISSGSKVSIVQRWVGEDSASIFELLKHSDTGLTEFRNNNYSGGVNGDYAFSDGKVGIGTTSPDQILTTRPTQAGKYGIHVIKPATNDSLGGIFVETDNTTSLYLKDRTQNPQSTVRLKGKGDSYFTGGKVGIGTQNPKHQLHVTGGVIQGSHQIRATGWWTGNNADGGPATEIGYSGDQGWIMTYDRSTSTYSNLNLQASNAIIRLDTTDGKVKISEDGGHNYSVALTSQNYSNYISGTGGGSSSTEHLSLVTSATWDTGDNAPAPQLELKSEIPCIWFNDSSSGSIKHRFFMYVESNEFYLTADTDNNDFTDTQILRVGNSNFKYKGSNVLTASNWSNYIAVVGSGTLTRNSEGNYSGNLTSASNSHKYRYQKVGNMVTIHFELGRTDEWGLNNGGWVAFSGLPFTPKEYSGYINKAVGTYTTNSTGLASAYPATIQSGKLYIWSNTGVSAHTSSLVGSITYET